MEALGKSPAQRYQSADELRADLLRFSEGQPVRAAKGDVAFFGADATRSVTAVPGDRTQAVPLMSGPRTDIPRRRRRANTSAWVGFVVALVVVAAAIGGFAYYENHKTTVSNMPGVVGQSESVAKKSLVELGFSVDVTYVKSKLANNTVVSTVPKVGTHVVKGQSVTLFLSRGVTTSPVTIKDYVGLSLLDAENEITTAKLDYKVVDTTTPPSNNAMPNVVLSQSPSGGTKAQTGDTVTLTVLAPGTKYPLADVSTMTVVAATSTLTNQGVVVTVAGTRTCSNTIAQGKVVSTDPPSGSLIQSGQSVQLILSSGFCQAVVPSVVGDTVSAATAALQGQGFQAAYQPDPTAICNPGSPQTVTSQSVQGGSSATYGSTITMLVCQLAVGTTTTTTTVVPPT